MGLNKSAKTTKFALLVLGVIFLIYLSALFIVAQGGELDPIPNATSSASAIDTKDVLTSYGITGMKIVNYSVNNIPIDKTDISTADFNLSTTFDRSGLKFRSTNDGLKQEVYIINNKATRESFNFTTIVQIDYNEVTWNGSLIKLGIYDKLHPFVFRTNNGSAPNIFMDNKYNKRINYQDVAEQGGYAIGYQDKGISYIEMIIKDKKIDAGSISKIDPTYFNQTDGFKVSGGARGITNNGSDFFIMLIDNKKIGTFNISGNLTNLTSTSFLSSGTFQGIYTNGSTFVLLDGTNSYVYILNSTWGNITLGFSLSSLCSLPRGATSNGSDFWFTCYNKDTIFHTNYSGFNMSDNFKIDSSNWGVYYNLSDFWISRTNTATNITHYNSTGGYIESILLLNYGISNPAGITTNVSSGTPTDFWIIDPTDAFVYHISITEIPANPILSIEYPSVNYFNSSNTGLNINYTAMNGSSLQTMDSCWYSNDSFLVNYSLTSCIENITNITWAEGKHNFSLWANDSLNYVSRVMINFTIDTINPSINITFPINNTEYINVTINFTISDTGTGVRNCWYSNDTYTKNTSITNCANITTVVWTLGNHNVTVWVNDSAGNQNSSTVNFTIISGDTEYPQFTSYWDNNATQHIGGTGLFNVTVTSTNGTVILTYNNTNYTASNSSGDATVFNVTIVGLTNGTYTYNWSSWGNGTNHLYNVSDTITYEVNWTDIYPPSFTYIPDNVTINYTQGFGVDFNATDDLFGGTFGYYSINWTTLFTINGSGWLTNSSKNLGAGLYWINVTINDTMNNLNSTIYLVNISRATSTTCGLFVNPGPVITYPTVSAYSMINLDPGDADVVYHLYRDGVDVGYPDTVTLGAGVYTYLVNCTGGQNWTDKAVCGGSALTVNQGTSQTSLTFDVASPQVYGTAITPICSIITGGTEALTLTNGTSGVAETLGVGNWSFNCSYAGNTNWTESSNFSIFNITQATPTVTYFINSQINNISVVYPTKVNATAYTNGGVLVIYRDGVNVTDERGLNADLGVNNYTYIFNVTGNQNYSDIVESTMTINVTQATGVIYTYLNGLRANITINATSSIWLNATLITGVGVIQLYNNETLINNGTSPLENYTLFNDTFLYNITSIYIGNENYTSAYETWWVNATNVSFILDSLIVTGISPLSGNDEDGIVIFSWNVTASNTLTNCTLYLKDIESSGGESKSYLVTDAIEDNPNYLTVSNIISSNMLRWYVNCSDDAGYSNISLNYQIDTKIGSGGDGGGGGGEGSLGIILNKSLLICNDTYKYALSDPKNYSKIFEILPNYPLENYNSIKSYIDNWQEYCSDLINRTLHPEVICANIYNSITANNGSWNNQTINYLRNKILSYIPISNYLLEFYVNNYNFLCYESNYSDKIINIIKINGSIECDFENLPSFFKYSLNFMDFNIGFKSCERMKFWNYFVKIEQSGDDYKIIGLKVFWIILLLILIPLLLIVRKISVSNKRLKKLIEK